MGATPARGVPGADSAAPTPDPTGADTATAARGSIANWTADDGNWTRATKDFAASRYSALDQITASNVARLRVAWTFSTEVPRGQEAAPLVVGSTMYVVTPYPNYLHALDLSRPGAPKKWTYDPKPASSAQGVACCDVVNRGAAYHQGKVIFNTLDGHTVAVDAETGREVWRTKVADINLGETLTMAPLVVRDRVLVGNSGGELGVRGWLTGLDANSGFVAWRAYSTGPDDEVLIGPAFTPFYAHDRGKDLGVTTWPPDAWRTGGGSVWGFLSYDPELDLIYYGTANAGPWNPEQRPGDNKWTAGVFARDPDDGRARWFFQWNPHDLYDWDGVNENILLDLPVGGRTRRVLVHPDRNGFLYVLDRETGEVLSADPFAHSTTLRGIDLRTGRPIHVEAKKPRTGVAVRELCPAAPGAKDWSPSAFSPRTGYLYMPQNNLCMDMETTPANYIQGTPYLGARVKMYPGPGGHRGEFTAWDVTGRRKAWSIRERFPVWGGAVATAGDVVFYGTMDGWFKAVHARTGEELWRFKVGSGVVGQPVTFRGPDGKQYVSVLAGVGGWAGAIVAGDLDPRDSSGALGFVGATTDLPNYTGKGAMLYTFALP